MMLGASRGWDTVHWYRSWIPSTAVRIADSIPSSSQSPASKLASPNCSSIIIPSSCQLNSLTLSTSTTDPPRSHSLQAKPPTAQHRHRIPKARVARALRPLQQRLGGSSPSTPHPRRRTTHLHGRVNRYLEQRAALDRQTDRQKDRQKQWQESPLPAYLPTHHLPP